MVKFCCLRNVPLLWSSFQNVVILELLRYSVSFWNSIRRTSLMGRLSKVNWTQWIRSETTMVLPGKYSRSKSYFWSFMKNCCILGWTMSGGLTEDRLLWLMIVEYSKVMTIEVLVKAFSSVHNWECFFSIWAYEHSFVYMVILLWMRWQWETIVDSLLNHDFVREEHQARPSALA
jgi:hypothetical protein